MYVLTNKLDKLRVGIRYVYLDVMTSFYGGGYVKTQYVGVFSGIDDEDRLVFTDVKRLHRPYTKRVGEPSGEPIAKIPVRRVLEDEDFLPLDKGTGGLIEANSADDILNYIKRNYINYIKRVKIQEFNC